MTFLPIQSHSTAILTASSIELEAAFLLNNSNDIILSDSNLKAYLCLRPQIGTNGCFYLVLWPFSMAYV